MVSEGIKTREQVSSLPPLRLPHIPLPLDSPVGPLRDAEHVAVLGDRPSRHEVAAAGEFVGEVDVRQGVGGVFVGNQLAENHENLLA